MARQYTKCISPANHLGKNVAQVIIAAAVAALAVLLAGAALVPGVAIVVLTAIIAYCRWWLYDRLVCLDGERCAVGWVSKVEPPSKKSGLDRFDTDYSFNLVLAPNVEGALQAAAENDGFQGDLIRNQLPGWDFTKGFTGMQEGQYSNRPSAALHAEFEGGGVYDLMIACLAALPFAVAAAAVCAIPVVGWIACGVLETITGLIFLIGIIVGLTDTGDPNDVNPGLGEIRLGDHTGRGADILVVRGTWVFDSAHDGWNELHPILHCQRTNDTWGGSWHTTSFAQPNTMAAVQRWCEKVTEVDQPETVRSQQQSANQWEVHPVIDGCSSPSLDQAPQHSFVSTGGTACL
jgi:hypothetical protein